MEKPSPSSYPCPPEAAVSEMMPICITFEAGYCFKNQKVMASLDAHGEVRTQAVLSCETLGLLLL